MKQIEPIAVFHSPFSSKFGIPRQSGLVSELTGRVVFEPAYADADALRGIDGFDYLWLIWGFSANDRHGQPSSSHVFHPTVRPPRLGGNERVGVFASRSPFRPNGLGLSSVRIVEVDAGDIVVSGADLMDGTPIYDIKPYLPYVDSHPGARGGFTDQRQWTALEVVIPDEIKHILTAKQVSELSEILALDPRPHYHKDSSRIYGMPFGGSDIRFRVSDGKVYVVEIKNQSI